MMNTNNGQFMEIDVAYEIFGRMMTEDKLYLSRRITFRRICRWLGVPRRNLDLRIRQELGMGGQELMRRYRGNDERSLREKYAIKCFKL